MSQSPLSFTAATATTWNANWLGESGRTYFLESSIDLIQWNYAPLIEFGTGPKSYTMPTAGATKLFVRLRYRDDAAVTTLQQAQDADFDGDGMPNAWELAYGLNPTNDQDSLTDLDADRISNVYEFANGTIPNSASSIPAAHITIDPSVVTETLTLKKTIQNGIGVAANMNRYTIIRVKPGTYSEALNISDNSFRKRILFLGDLGANLPLIAPTSGTALSIYSSSVVFDGFAITWGGSTKTSSGYGVFFYGNAVNDQARLVNCTLSGLRSVNGSAANVAKGLLSFEHCTITDNGSWDGGKVIVLQSAGRMNLVSSIVWNPAPTVTKQIDEATTGSATATSCIILGGELGASAAAPKMDRYYGLLAGSPAIGTGLNRPFSSLDRHGEVRPGTAPDIGADQWQDSDADALPDWWENHHFGDLSKVAAGDNDLPSPDGLSNKHEYLLGFNPLTALSSGGPDEDLYDAVFTRRGDPWYPVKWWLDPDGDGLTDNYELYYQTSPGNTDTNADGLSDLAAIFSARSPTSSDTDGDGIENSQELINGTNPLLSDTDGDGVSDAIDPLPLDPLVSSLPDPSPADNTGPLFSLQQPAGAILQP